MVRIVALLILPAAAAAGLLSGSAELVGDEPIETRAVVWGDRAFADPGKLEAWLSSRGAEYREWAARHPAAAARLEGRPKPAPLESTAGRPADRRAAEPAPARRESSAATEAGGARTSPAGWARAVDLVAVTTLAIALLGVALLAVGVVPALPGVPAGALVVEHRPHFLAAGVSLLLGLGLGAAF